MAVKVRSDGETLILRATINFTAFNSLVENIRIGETGLAFVINSEGRLQTRTDADIPKADVLWLADLPRPEKGAPLYTEMKDQAGHNLICITSALQNIDWIMVFRQDSSDAFSELRKTQLLTLIIFILSCAAIVFVAVTLPRSMVRLISSADQKSEAMNKQVIESGKLATIGELAAGIAHEINNPVAIMMEEAGWIEDLLSDEPPDASPNTAEYQRALKQINTQGKRCKDITHKLLSFARKTDYAINDVQVNDAIREIVSLSAQMAKYNNISIETRLEKDLPDVRLSPSELQQVVLNLINNASDALKSGAMKTDAMKKEGGQILIETGLNIEKDRLVISIEDNGPGIPKDILERIFDPFFTTKPVGKGTGLGLSICYGIIQKMGGAIEVYSQVGIGTKFRIFIPLPEASKHTDTAAGQALAC